MRIYTKTGDNGTTGLIDGSRRPKHDARITAYGDIDELQAVLGMVQTSLNRETFKDIAAVITHIQNLCFEIGSELANPKPNALALAAEDVAWLEGRIDDMDGQLSPLRSFILPGGSVPAAYLHLARTVCRRAERSVTLLDSIEPVASSILAFLNRLSDLLFVMARLTNVRLGVADKPWAAKGSKLT